MKHFGVIGHPVHHSLSPLLHSTAYALLGLECAYEAFDIEPEGLSDAIRDFSRRGFAGLNVTIPHKESVVEYVDDLSSEAKAVGAVNTISFVNGRVTGHNTDIGGAVASLEPYRGELEGRQALVLGAGGSSRAIVFALATGFKPSAIVIANRDEARAVDLATRSRTLAPAIAISGSSASDQSVARLLEASTLVINATSLGMIPAVDYSPVGRQAAFRREQIVFDLIYTPLETAFLRRASQCGARTINGLEMFLQQGAGSFERWLGRPMPVDEIRPILLKALTEERN